MVLNVNLINNILLCCHNAASDIEYAKKSKAYKFTNSESGAEY